MKPDVLEVHVIFEFNLAGLMATHGSSREAVEAAVVEFREGFQDYLEAQPLVQACMTCQKTQQPGNGWHPEGGGS